ncbi:LD-carboxypeptidase [Candidatus Marsarchaeota archaeon]|jgi:muramoyltetrapeptide carboxypeptidase|nr:LD-carboxypeptidase [Candidatus Marsarchaeota archaeon]MCL5092822.1 LD-carboxypeptidase [Candidatus Marsarchaeota archaeon]
MHEKIVKPRALKPGDTIKIIAPSSMLTSEYNLSQALKFLKDKGFKVSLSKSMTQVSNARYFTAGDHIRTAEIENAFKSDDIDAIIALKGGAGAIDLINMIDYDIIKDHPKIFIGSSDITLLQLAFLKKAGLVTFQGPMLIDLMENNSSILKHNWTALIDIIQNGSEAVLRNPEEGAQARTLIEGTAKGRIIGGNLSMIALIANTGYMPKTDGSLLFLEDVNVEPWVLDNLLTSLFIRGVIQKARGVFFGGFPHYGVKNAIDTQTSTSYIMESIFTEDYLTAAIHNTILDIMTRKAKIPSFVEFACCHGEYVTTVPIGVNGELDSEEKTVTMLESAVEL